MSILESHLNPTYWWPKLELDSRTALMMMKGALAPTITIAMYVKLLNREQACSATTKNDILTPESTAIKVVQFQTSLLLLGTCQP